MLVEVLHQSQAQNYKVVEHQMATCHQGKNVISDGQNNVSAMGRGRNS